MRVLGQVNDLDGWKAHRDEQHEYQEALEDDTDDEAEEVALGLLASEDITPITDVGFFAEKALTSYH